MFVLVLYSDDFLYVCNLRDITVHPKSYSARYKDKKKYACRILAMCEMLQTLNDFKHVIETGGYDIFIENKQIEFINVSKETKVSQGAKLFIEESLFYESSDCWATLLSFDEILLQDLFDKPAIFYNSKLENDKEKSFILSRLSKLSEKSDHNTEDQNIEDREGQTQNKIKNTAENNDPTVFQTLENSKIEQQFKKTENFLNVSLDVSLPELDNFIFPQNSCDSKLDNTLISSDLKKSVGDEKIDETFPVDPTYNKIVNSVQKNNCVKIVEDKILNGVVVKNPVVNSDINSESFNLQSWNLSNINITSDDFDSPILQSTLIDFNANENNAGIKISNNPELIDKAVNSDDENDRDYEPSYKESTDSDQENDEREVSNSRKNKSINITLGIDKFSRSAPDDTELFVDTSSNTQSKKYFCFYCKKLLSKLARHLQLVHPNEEDVQKFMLLPPKNKERQSIIARIRKNGNHLYNTDRRFNVGKLLVCRRPNERMHKSAEDFIACGNCRGQYSRSVIRHHWRMCTNRDGKKERLAMVKGRKVSARINERANNDVRKYIFPYFREDKIVRTIRYDELIIMFANKQCEKYAAHQHHHQMIRQRLRLLGRFFKTIKDLKNEIIHFAEIFQPKYYDATIAAVRIVAGFNENKRRFDRPSVAANIGGLLKKVGDILRSECIKKEKETEQKRVENYLSLLKEDYGTSINRIVTETQTENNRRREIKLPSTADIKKLNTYLKDERTKYFLKLKEKYSYDAWKNLAETTLLSLQVFNCRRPGEIERLYIEDFHSHRSIEDPANKEAFDALSPEGKVWASKFVRFEIRGKLGRGVPVLVPIEVLDCINLLISHRQNANIPESNQYLFGLPSTDKDRCRHLRACDLMREFAEKCGAQIPDTLRGTQLRKHIATRSINLNLSDDQVSNLANFMGHHEKIHKQIYRQSVLETDVVKISKILIAAQGTEDISDDSNEEQDSVSCTKKTTSTANVQSNDEPKFKNKLRKWSIMEQDVIMKAFRDQLLVGTVPSGKDMKNLIDNNDCLKGRTVPQLRTWIHTNKKKLTL